MPIVFGPNIKGNIVNTEGQGPGAVSAPSNQGNLVVSGGPHSDGPRQYEREFTPSPSPVDISGFPSPADQANFQLQNLVQNKDYLQQFPSTQTPGTNLYQEGIANFINTSPLNREIYKDTFPIGGAFNLFMTEVPEKIAQSTMLGNILSSIQSGASQAKDFVGGLFPGDNTDLNNLFQDFASIPAGIKKDASQMLKDLTPGVSEVREELGVKKQDATDIVETAFSDETMKAMSAGDPVNFVGDTKGLFLTTPQGAVPATISNLSATQDPFLSPSLPFSEQTYPYYQQTLKQLGLKK
jgi:hypothetical protein